MEFTERVKKMEKVMRKWQNYGADDTEPHTALQVAMANALYFGEVKPPTSGAKWGLFVSSMKCGKATRELTKEARKLLAYIAKNNANNAIFQAVVKYCWRVF